MSPSRTFLVALLVLLPLVLSVEASPPTAIPNVSGTPYETGLTPAALAMDAQGAYVFVAMRPDATATCGTSTDVNGIPVNSLPCKPDLVAYDLKRNTQLSTFAQGPGEQRPSGDATAPVAVAVTPGDAGSSLQNTLVVKAGPGPEWALFRATQSAPVKAGEEKDREADGGTKYNLRAAAISKDNTRIAVGGGHLTEGFLQVMNGPTVSTRWNRTFSDGETVTAIAIAKDNHRAVVGTTKAVYYYPDVGENKAFTKVVTSPVRAVDIDDDGSAVVVGLQNGEVYYFVPVDQAGEPSNDFFQVFFSSSDLAPGPVNDVAVSGDGKLFGAVSENKWFALWEGNATGNGATGVRKYRDATDVAFKKVDTGNGRTFVASGGAIVAGYTPTRESPAWSIPLVDDAVDVAISRDGNRLAATSKTRFYAWQQTSDVLIDGLVKEKHAQPSQIVPFTYTLTNAGSLEDNYVVTVYKPSASWIVEGERQSFLLAPDASQEVTFTLQSPATEVPAKHMTRIEVFSQGLNKVVRKEYFNVTLAAVSNLRMESDQGTTLDLNQGEEIPYNFKIINQGNSYARLNISVTQSPTQGPPWTVLVPEQEQNLTQGETRNLQATITAPRDADDGTCNVITLVARSGRAGAQLPVTACINPAYQIVLTLEQDRVQPKPGETAVVNLRVENRGNTKDEVELETSIVPASAALDWRVQVSPTEIELPRGGVRTATVSVRGAVVSPPDVTITVRATSLGGSTQSATLMAAAPALEDTNGLPLPAWTALLALGAAAGIGARRRW